MHDLSSTDQVFAFMESRTNLEARGGLTRAYRLERMEALMEGFNYPARRIPTIHIAGSKGKGSTAAYATALLQSAGFTVGRYTSPHIHHYRERIRVYEKSGEPRDVDNLYLRFGRDLYDLVQERVAAGYEELDLPTTFELLTLLAFLVFQEARCNIVVLETGLGGRLDATNVCHPLATIITSIEREHTEYLGETIREIAAEKAGIIKPGIPLFLAPQTAEAREEILKRARQVAAPVFPVEEHLSAAADPVQEGLRTTIAAIDDTFRCIVTLPMVGMRQPWNLALAIFAVGHPSTGLLEGVSPETVSRALVHLDLPARGEIHTINTRPCILDGAHTPESVSQLAADISRRGYAPVDLLFSAVEGKETTAMIEHLVPIARSVHITRAGTFRRSSPEQIAATWKRIAPSIPVTVSENPADAFRSVTEGGTDRSHRPIVVTGSFYLVAEIRPLVLQSR